MKQIIPLAFVVAVSACAIKPDPTYVGSAQIDGFRVGVFQFGDTPVYNAQAESGHGLGPGDPRRYSINVRGIEAVTHCKVDPATIDNAFSVFGGATSAAVVCGK